ncbi:putative Ubiquitin-like domain, Heat shock chaperonin-binding, UBA-like superfamily, ubiquilin [Helianthus annuus]|uniref:Putative ubiquitin family protein n=1 Tax=Helianthus annuus TaxID=4232 RepID=A0A251RMV7_HELAN|nr:ubiquitin domain-containing protein DSK2a [Helianthus annuus]KAF5754672.1 putative UBA-like superfamily, ubiquilin, Ubiquitin-like domain superfamily [Helianthus annuus]KAJ0428522.1 putative Ubiquitin-like domain, Heat shock chaperonin-binding, UBA-like superfamily [Helianthus annuus]KAJ0446862.1 putative Ubiquitin-like domain, Heat shock chaperonin-binding, UBA-like superfamily [Helianthus annuus]KAJ0631756.1 putative Ubiquitin-like domain, Heat shock chaperonin-binding, UBA-like superfamil
MGVESESTQTAVDGADAEINLNIRCSNGNKFSVRSTLRSTIVEFKDLLAQNCDVPANQQRLIYKGRILKDDQTLDSYGLQADHTIHMVRGSAPAPTPAAPQGSGPNEGVGLGGAGTGAPLFPGLGSGGLRRNAVSELFESGLPEFEQVQEQLAQHPEIMIDMMNMPSVQTLLNNPEIMRGMIMSNPHMREIIDRNPELAHILNDPAILRQTLETARNPELMREMVRNTDRAMSNIESSPEGFNMLRRMYENVQEPFLNATTTGGNDTGSNPFAALLGNQGAVNNPSATGSETTPGSAAPNSNPLPNPWGGTTGGAQTNAGTRAPNVSGLGGPGLPGLDRPTGMPDMSQLMQNPAISQMMQSLLSNPQYMEQVVSQNPQLRAMFDANPQLREMMQNPEVLRQLTSPQMMQQMMSLQQLLPQLNQQQSALDPTQTGAATGAQNNMGLDLLMNMFGGLGAGGLAVPNVPDVPPEQLYATQLSQLQEMGFFDTQENIRALRATAGNVHAAVERLLGNFGP